MKRTLIITAMVAATVLLSLVSVPSAQAQVGVNYSYNLTPLRTVERETSGAAFAITNIVRKTAWSLVDALQDLNSAASASTNTMAVTYVPYGSTNSYRVGAWSACVAGAEAVQTLANYPLVEYGGVLTFTPSTTTNCYVLIKYFNVTSYNP